MDIELTVPNGSEAVVYVPAKNSEVKINGEKTVSNVNEGEYNLYKVRAGAHKISAR